MYFTLSMHHFLISLAKWTKNWSIFDHFYCNFGPVWTQTRFKFGFKSGSQLWTRVPGSQTRGWTHYFEDCMWGTFKNTYKVVLLLAFFVMIRLKIWKNMEFFSHWLLSLSVWSHLFVYRHQWFDKLTDYCWFGFQIIMYSIACAKNEKICPKFFWWI